MVDERHHVYARHEILDGAKASIAAAGAAWSMIKVDSLIAVLTLIYMVFLLTEKVWKFFQWRRQRKAEKVAAAMVRASGP